MTRLVDRSTWNAKKTKGEVLLSERPRGVKYHYVGSPVPVALADDHRKCVELVKSIQRQHMEGNLWADIGYTALVCWHRDVFIGRGPGVLCAANGPGLNAGHYAVCALLGTKGLTDPSDDMLHGLVDAREWLQALPARQMPCGPEVAGHRDGYATDCPGEPLYRWVRAGARRPGAGGGARPQPPAWPGRVLSYPPLMTGLDVRTWQARMRQRGWRIAVDGKYGPESTAVARAFQREKGLRADGKVGRETWAAAWTAPIT